MTYPRIILRDFTKGWNYSDLPAELADDEFYSSQSPVGTGPRIIERPDVVDAQFQKLRNLFVNRLGRLRVRGGSRAVLPATLANPITGLTRYFNATLARLVYAAGAGVWSFNEATQTPATLIGNIVAGSKVDFVSLYDVLYWCDGTSARKWNGLTTTDQALGVAPPATACVGIALAAGNLSSTPVGTSPYQWYYTFVEADGTESNPSPASASVSPNAQSVTLTGINASVNPAVTARNIYRVGGTVTTYRLVASVSDNTTNTYTDNTLDTSLGPNLLSFAHDPPPSGISFFAGHKQRLFAAGDLLHPYRLYLSSYAQANYWPTTIYDPLNDGGYFDMPDPEFGNSITGLVGTGSLLLVACKKSFYAVYGDTFNDFAARKLCDTGCVARRTLVRCKDTVLFLSGDGMVYSLQDVEPKPIALPLETLLQAVAPSDLVNASAVYQDQRYTLFIPQVNKAPVNICYDFRAGSWTDLSDPLLAAGACYGQPNTSLVGETLIATAPGYLDATGTAYNGVLSVLLHTPSTVPVNIDFQTPVFEFGRPSFTKRAKRLKLEGFFAAGSGNALTATITASTPGRADVVKSYPLNASAAEGKLLDVELSPKLVARRLCIEIAGTVTTFELNTIEFAFQFIREAA